MSASHDVSKRFACLVVRAGSVESSDRDVVVERPLRLLVNGEPAATLMRTPGAEVELATGFLFTEGLVRSAGRITAASYCPDAAGTGVDVVRVDLAEPAGGQVHSRYRDVFSSGGPGAVELLEVLAEGLPRFDKPAGRLRSGDVFRLRDAMETAQAAFRSTGGTHAAALAELPVEATPQRIVVREDLGRHNALDKAVGAAVAGDFVPARSLLFLSGRLSCEMVAKAARAGIGDLAGVSAPSALGVELARRLGMFLAGFVRGDAMTVYSGDEALGAAKQELSPFAPRK